MTPWKQRGSGGQESLLGEMTQTDCLRINMDSNSILWPSSLEKAYTIVRHRTNVEQDVYSLNELMMSLLASGILYAMIKKQYMMAEDKKQNEFIQTKFGGSD